MTSETNLFYEEERAENKAIADAMAARTMTEETAALIREMRDLIADAHDTHIYAEGDDHPITCPYCHAVQWANALLRTHNKEPL